MARQPFFVVPEAFEILAAPAVPGRPGSHLKEYLYPGMIWRTSGPPFVIVDLGVPKSVDCVALLGLTQVQGSSTIQFTMASTTERIISGPVDYNKVSAVWAPPPVPAIGGLTPAQFMTELETVQTWRYAACYFANFVDAESVQAQFLVLGKKVTFSRYAEHDWEVGLDDLSTVTMTRGLVPDIAEGGKLRTISFTMKWVSEAEYFEKVAPLDMAVGRSQPVLLSFDPDATTRREQLIFFGLLRENPRTRRANARAFERRFDMLSFI